MTPRELVIKTLNHEPVSPRGARRLAAPRRGLDPRRGVGGTERSLSERHRSARSVAPAGKEIVRQAEQGGDHTDAWGCVWHGAEQGAPPELKQSPLAEAEKIASYQPPMELLDRSRFAKVNKSCLATNRFVLAWSEVRPFDRLRFLRGSEATLVDLTRGTKEVRDLLAMLHDFNCQEIERWAETEVDGVAFRDDWGSAEGLLIAPETWREIFRPLYREYCKMLHAKDKFVFFRSDGQIGDIFGDLAKVGIDAIHAQLHLMDAARLTKRFRGRVTFWGGQDSKLLSHPGPVDDFRKAVQTVRKELDFGSGGVIAQCRVGPGHPRPKRCHVLRAMAGAVADARVKGQMTKSE